VNTGRSLKACDCGRLQSFAINSMSLPRYDLNTQITVAAVWLSIV
jgi:hypothetical protein